MTGANLLSFIMFGTDKATQAFPTFGPERQGAPMMAFTRVDSQKIGDRSIIQSPNLVIVLDPSLLPRVEYTGELAKGGVVIVNYNGSASDLKINPKYKVYAVDASGISNELFKRNFPNSPLVGAAARILGVDLATIESRVNEFMPKEKEKNAEAARRGYHSIK